jgi:hypothetical protein
MEFKSLYLTLYSIIIINLIKLNNIELTLLSYNFIDLAIINLIINIKDFTVIKMT